MSIINRTQVLKLNSAWQAVGQSTVGKALVDMAAGQSALALDIEYEKDERGEYILDENGWPVGQSWPRAVTWEEWIQLPVRSFDDVIHYCNGSKVMRAPTVIIAKNFGRMPKKIFKGKPSKDAIWIRDRGIDQYTGKKLKRENATIDHVIPQSRGGPNTWENLALTAKEINSKKGNKLNHEVGLTLINEPKAPRPIPLSHLIREIRHFSWKPHLPHLAENN
jgi:5-methylcytosine-specific restriction endonuclease McrA